MKLVGQNVIIRNLLVFTAVILAQGAALPPPPPHYQLPFVTLERATATSTSTSTATATATATATVSLPAIFADHMVLQQNQDIVLWGWAKPLEEIIVKPGWADVEYKTVTDNQARWSVVLKTPKAGGPYDISISGHSQILLKDVLIGEVWLCSGQSNMEWSANAGINNAKEEVAIADHPNIRFFTVAKRTAGATQNDVTGTWVSCTPETMSDFSAVAYFFARKIQEETGVPIGLINSTWGGAPTESWMPEASVSNNPLLAVSANKLPKVPWGPSEPGRIFNAMISPLTAFRIAGVLWYQGEANTANADTYQKTFETLIKNWRTAWGYSFPFIYAQIAPYAYGNSVAGAIVRDAQRRALRLPRTGMVVTSDIGDTTDIHPRNKLDVGLRMAAIALKIHYKLTEVEVFGPLYQSHKAEKGRIEVSFKHSDGLHSKGGEPAHFEIAGEDGIFFPAVAEIKKEKVWLTSEKVPAPLFVRYAWSNTATPNLFNRAGLPASCFTTKAK